MFRYLARRHDRKHIIKSLQRQKLIEHRSIKFKYDSSLTFAIHKNEAKSAESIELELDENFNVQAFFSPILPPEPINESTDQVVFQSDITTEEKENNIFDFAITDSGTKEHAIVVFHHWYARNRYSAFAKFFAARDITVVEATLPYHFRRGSDDFSEEKLLNADINLTIRSMRQAVLDGRKLVRWLGKQGYYKISVVGMCIGGLVAGLIAAHEEKVGKAVLMVSPAKPAELVWTAETLRGLRSRIEPAMSLDELKSAWGLIDLENHLSKLTRPHLNIMFVLGKEDTIVCPYLSDRVIDELEKRARRPEVLRLNCGHSSVGIFPFNLIAAHRVLRFLKDWPTVAEMLDVRNFRYDFSELSSRRQRTKKRRFMSFSQ
ncbi:alpha/beta hydrolase family protein [Brucella anthropi]|uniref:alpha/beta hydrolase family protein n=1 Tax=Brucella anthropi TaxID=529 RepID=UPI003D9575EA